VWYDGLADEPRAEREPLSRFLLQFTLCEAAFVGPYGGFAAIGSEQAQQLVALLRNVPLQPMRWPSDPTHYYVGQGVVAMVCDTGDDTFEVFLGSRHRSALRSLRDPGFTWQSFSG
jgi:hypothetical protein